MFHRRLATRDVAFIAIFTALYVVLGFLKISPIIGLPGQAITAAAILAPLMGIILGPYVGALSALLGGVAGFFSGSFSLLSLASGAIASFCSGLIYTRRRMICILIYAFLLILFAFYPIVGPAWLYPSTLWFQIVGFFILISPLQSLTVRNFDSKNNSAFLCAFFLTSLVSTLAGQLAGSLTLEMIPAGNPSYYQGTWMMITFLYPIERVVIALGATLVGAPLHRVLKRVSLLPVENAKRTKQDLG